MVSNQPPSAYRTELLLPNSPSGSPPTWSKTAQPLLAASLPVVTACRPDHVTPWLVTADDV